MSDRVDAAGLPTELSGVDYLLHRGEANPRTRSGMIGVEILDCAPDWTRFRSLFDNVSRRVLRLRQKVVVPSLPTAPARWVVDPDFNLDFHVRRVRVPAPGGLREVLDLAEVALQSPMDMSRPLWSVTLVEGLADGRAATLMHLSHAVSDGVGSAEMFGQIYDLERDPPARPMPPIPVPEDLSPGDLTRAGINQLPAALLGGTRDAIIGAVSVASRAVRNPWALAAEAFDYARSGTRVVSQAAEHSPLLRQRSLISRTEALDVRLADLHRAAKAGGGSINDAYLSALSGALGRYHRELGVPISTLPMAIPVNLRAEADPAGGNRFTGVNLAAPIGVVDPVERMRRIRAQMTARRDEPAMDLIGSIAPLLSVLPDPVLEKMTESVVGADVQASNVAFYPGETYLAGAKVVRHYGLGPLPGVAMMVVLISRGGQCTVTVRYDRAAVRDEALFTRCLVEGFDEVLALAGDPIARCVPASFPAAT